MDLNLHLPGETPLDDYSGLKLKHVKTAPQLNEAEYLGMLAAVDKYLGRKPTKRMAPFTSDWMLRLHRQMFGEIWLWAGKLRSSDKNIGVRSHLILPLLAGLCGDIVYWDENEGPEPIQQAAMLQHRAVYIHPFDGGNGRWSRLLANIWLARNGHPIIDWPEKVIVQHTSAIRSQYIRALKEADKGDYEPFFRLCAEYTPSVSSPDG